MSQNWPSADGVRETAAGCVGEPSRMASATSAASTRGVFTPGYYPTSPLAVNLVHVVRARLHFGEPRGRVRRRMLQEFLPLGRRQPLEMCRVVPASADEPFDECLLEMRGLIFNRPDIGVASHASIMRAPARPRRDIESPL